MSMAALCQSCVLGFCAKCAKLAPGFTSSPQDRRSASFFQALRKDDRVTVSGEARAIKVSTDGQPFIEVTACSIVPHHDDMVEAEQDQESVVH